MNTKARTASILLGLALVACDSDTSSNDSQSALWHLSYGRVADDEIGTGRYDGIYVDFENVRAAADTPGVSYWITPDPVQLRDLHELFTPALIAQYRQDGELNTGPHENRPTDRACDVTTDDPVCSALSLAANELFVSYQEPDAASEGADERFDLSITMRAPSNFSSETASMILSLEAVRRSILDAHGIDRQ